MSSFSVSLRSALERDLAPFDLYLPQRTPVPDTSANVEPVLAERTLTYTANPELSRVSSSSAFKGTCGGFYPEDCEF
jgi:hypothetical protein